MAHSLRPAVLLKVRFRHTAYWPGQSSDPRPYGWMDGWPCDGCLGVVFASWRDCSRVRGEGERSMPAFVFSCASLFWRLSSRSLFEAAISHTLCGDRTWATIDTIGQWIRVGITSFHIRGMSTLYVHRKKCRSGFILIFKNKSKEHKSIFVSRRHKFKIFSFKLNHLKHFLPVQFVLLCLRWLGEAVGVKTASR